MAPFTGGRRHYHRSLFIRPYDDSRHGDGDPSGIALDAVVIHPLDWGMPANRHMVLQSGQNRRGSGVLGKVPGGLSQMVLIADQFKMADAGTVAMRSITGKRYC